MDLVPVQFVQPYRAYNAGEVAGFGEAVSWDLVARGIAVPYNAASPAVVPEVPDPQADIPVIRADTGEQIETMGDVRKRRAKGSGS